MEQYNNIQQAYKKNPSEERKPVSFTILELGVNASYKNKQYG